LNLANNPKFKKLLKVVEKAFKKLHKKGEYKLGDIEGVPEYQALVSETTSVLNRAFEDNDLSEDMLESLQNDVFYFSSIKTHAQLFEASRLLLTEDKKIKSFQQFSHDITKLKKDYNETYLESEYDFAVGSVQMADRWDNFNDNDRYYLQYRTAGDDKVRKSHQPLHNTTLPKDDPFWDVFFPPNGWRCRCTTVEVLKATSKKSDSKKAYKKGETATTQIGKNGKNKLQIFQFNAGKQKVVFPPKHPYNKVKGAKTVKEKAKQKTRENGSKKSS
jgi:SPP1 gp7 family putative phage head morphogenesis protein